MFDHVRHESDSLFATNKRSDGSIKVYNRENNKLLIGVMELVGECFKLTSIKYYYAQNGKWESTERECV